MKKSSKRRILNEKTRSCLDVSYKEFKFLGLKLKSSLKKKYMRLSRFSMDEAETRSFLGFTHKKVSLKNGFFTFEQIRLGKAVLFARQTTPKSVFKSVLGIKLAKQDREKLLLKKYAKYAPPKVEGLKRLVVFVNTASGEYFTFLRFIYLSYLAKNGYSEPHFVFNKRYHENLNLLFKLKNCHYDRDFLPDLPARFVATKEVDFLLIFDFEYFFRTDAAMKEGRHYLKSMQKWLGVEDSLVRLLDWQIDKEKLENVKEEARLLGLDLENFIFLAPKATSMEEKDELFDELLSYAKEKGMDVYVNLAPGDLFVSKNPYKNSALSMEGALYLACMAKAVVGIRSGLLEQLTLSKVPIFALYTKLFRDDITPTQVRAGYSLREFPGVNKAAIFEYDFESSSEEEIVSEIKERMNYI